MKHFLLAATILSASLSYADAMKDTVFYNGAWSSGFTSIGNVLHANSKNKDRILEKCSALYSSDYCEENLVFTRVLNYRGKYKDHLSGNASYLMGRLKGEAFVKNIIFEQKETISQEEIERGCDKMISLGRKVIAEFSTRRLSKMVAVDSTTLYKSSKTDLSEAYFYHLKQDGETYPNSEWQAEARSTVEVILENDLFLPLALDEDQKSLLCEKFKTKLEEQLASQKIDLMNDYVFGHQNYNYSTVTDSLEELEQIFRN